MPSQNRIRVAKKLIASLEREGYTPNCHPQYVVTFVADAIWTARGGATKLDVARWGVDSLPCLKIEKDPDHPDMIVPIHVGSWATLAEAARGSDLPLIKHSHRSFEA